jgi:CRISPR-associated protein (TIGR03984 family)
MLSFSESDRRGLYSYQTQNTTLPDAIASCSDLLKDAIALLYSPTECNILKLNSGQLEDASAKTFKCVEKVFEARIFNQNNELRWLNRNSGNGQAVLLSETEILTAKPESFEKEEINYQECIPQKYLLWGETVSWDDVHSNYADFQKGWQRLTEARLDKIDIPLDEVIAPKQRVYLETCEYIAEKDFGNMVIIEERLIKLCSK